MDPKSLTGLTTFVTIVGAIVGAIYFGVITPVQSDMRELRAQLFELQHDCVRKTLAEN